MAFQILIIGQGIAGTALGLELEAAGVDFRVMADSHADAASRIAAGLINPVTGQRFVKSWRVDELLPFARAAYRRWEERFGVKLWHPVELRRIASRAIGIDEAQGNLKRKVERGELAPYVTSCDRDCIEVTGAAWVDLPVLLAKARERWMRDGRLVEARVGDDLRGSVAFANAAECGAVVLCVGAGGLAARYFPELKAVPVKGEILTVDAKRAAFDVSRVWHDGTWIRAESSTRARVGATYEPGVANHECTNAAQVKLLHDATELMRKQNESSSGRGSAGESAAGGAFDDELRVTGHDAGVRFAAKDRLPVAGWSTVDQRVGILGALGSKGALWAPWLAYSWAQHLANGSSLDPVVSPQRFGSVSDASR